MNNKVRIPAIISAFCTLVSALTGVLYTYGGTARTVSNIYGQDIILYGDGIYANNSLLKAGATKGADIVMLLVVLLLLLSITILKNKNYVQLLQAGLLVCLLYDSICLIMGVSFNRLFLLYLVQFSSSLFGVIISLSDILRKECFKKELYAKKMRGTALFLFIGGCSVLVWLTFIIPAIVNGNPDNFIEIYTTEPTFAIDLGIIFPLCIWCGIGLLRKKKEAYVIASIMMTLVICVGVCVIFQTIIQLKMGIQLEPGQILGMVVSFVVLGVAALLLNIRLLKNAINISSR